MCGIFGYCGENPSIDKIKILGIYNEVRGRDACGVFINQMTLHGNNAERTFTSFIENTVFPEPKKNTTIIGHTRNSSVGGTKAEFTHPYEIKLSDDKRKLPDLIGAHNGTIYNWEELAAKYGMSTVNYNDSKFLFNQLAKKRVSVLEKYDGHAAFLATSPKEKDTIWIYRGASKNSYKVYNSTDFELPNKDNIVYSLFGKDFYKIEKTDDINDYKEERPLFAYAENESSIYFSSLEDSLKAIGGDEDTVFPIPINRLIKLKNGKLMEIHDINREKSEHFFTSNAYTTKKNSQKFYQNNKSTFSKESRTSPIGKSGVSTTGASVRIANDVLSLTQIEKYGDDQVYYEGGKYRLGKRTIEDGIYFLNEKGKIGTKPEGEFDSYAFVGGHLLMLFDDFDEVMEKRKLNNKFRTAGLSTYAAHPIPSETDSSEFYFNASLDYSLSFKVPFARDITLKIVNGALKSFTINTDIEEKFIAKSTSKKTINGIMTPAIKTNEFVESFVTNSNRNNKEDSEYNAVNNLMELIHESQNV